MRKFFLFVAATVVAYVIHVRVREQYCNLRVFAAPKGALVNIENGKIM